MLILIVVLRWVNCVFFFEISLLYKINPESHGFLDDFGQIPLVVLQN